MEPSERDWGPKIPFCALVVGKGIQYVQSSTYNLLTNIILVDGGHWTFLGPFKIILGLLLDQKRALRANIEPLWGPIKGFKGSKRGPANQMSLIR